MSCISGARKCALECAEKLEATARGYAILRSMDATNAAKWLREMAAEIRTACGPEDDGEIEE